MPRGGSRPGAGRKKGSKTRRRRQVAQQAAARGITPLEVMLEAMRAHHEAGRLDSAAEVARHAAPYVHPRLSAMHLTGAAGQPLLDVEAQRRALANPDARRHLAALDAALAQADQPGGAGAPAVGGALANGAAPATGQPGTP